MRFGGGGRGGGGAGGGGRAGGGRGGTSCCLLTQNKADILVGTRQVCAGEDGR